MEAPKSKQPIIVGIDFGHTFSGIAYSAPFLDGINNSFIVPSLDIINCWPNQGDKVANKVPTKIAYRILQKRCAKWGFDCNHLETSPIGTRAERSSHLSVQKFFKLWLDPEMLDLTNGILKSQQPDSRLFEPIQLEDVRTYITDFLREIRVWTLKKLGEIFPLEDASHIEFHFSVPTVWSDQVVQDFDKCITNAGYRDVKNHWAEIAATEARAAALYTSLSGALYGKVDGNQGLDNLAEGEVLLVCDAGGGTTDVSVIEVTSVTSNKVPILKEIKSVEGRIAGSVEIDNDFEELLIEELSKTSQFCLSRANIPDVARRTTMGDFQKVKERFGDGDHDNLRTIPVEIHEMGTMYFETTKIEAVFDKQISKIEDAIEAQLNVIADHFAAGREHCQIMSPNVVRIVLAGGLGSSKYVMRKLMMRFCPPGETFGKHDLSIPVKIMVANEPQLVVCRGLVLEGMRKYWDVKPITGFRARACYGLTFQRPYDKSKPLPAGVPKPRKNPIDGQWYFADIKWFIHHNQFIDEGQPIVVSMSAPHLYDVENHFEQVLHEVRCYEGRCIKRSHESSRLPQKVCTLHYNFAPLIREISDGAAVDERRVVEVEKKHLQLALGSWKRVKVDLRTKFLRVYYTIETLPGPTNLNFALKFDDEVHDQGEHKLNVTWEAHRSFGVSKRVL